MSTEILGPWLTPEIQIVGIKSGSNILIPPSRAAITQSQGEPSKEYIFKGTF